MMPVGEDPELAADDVNGSTDAAAANNNINDNFAENNSVSDGTTIVIPKNDGEEESPHPAKGKENGDNSSPDSTAKGFVRVLIGMNYDAESTVAWVDCEKHNISTVVELKQHLARTRYRELSMNLIIFI